MVWYLDTSAFMKLVIDEEHSQSMHSWFTAAEPPTCVSSDLLRTEALRTARRLGEGYLERARTTLRMVKLRSVDSSLFDRASELDPKILRSLDAIHLAVALSFGPELDGFVTEAQRSSPGARVITPDYGERLAIAPGDASQSFLSDSP